MANQLFESPISTGTHSSNLLTPVTQSTDNHRSSLHLPSTLNNHVQEEHRHRSSGSSSSFLFGTPCSSLSRTTTTISQTASISPPIRKIDAITETNDPSTLDMIIAWINQTGLNRNSDQLQIDYDPIELAKEICREHSLFLVNSNETLRSPLIKKQYLRFGRYEIEVPFPIDNDQVMSTRNE